MFKLMIIDDDLPIVRFLEQALPWEELGFHLVTSFTSSLKALEQFKIQLPDVVLTDIGIPQMDGLNMADEMKRLKPELRLIFLTHHENFQYAKRAIQLDADDYINKDEINTDRLLQGVSKILSVLKARKTTMDQSDYKEDVQRNLIVLKQSFLDEVLAGLSSKEKLVSFGNRLGVDWIYSDFMLALHYMDLSTFCRHYTFIDFRLIVYGAYNIAQELADEWQRKHPLLVITPFLVNHTIVKDTQPGLIILMNFRKSVAMSNQSLFARYLGQLQSKVKQYLKVAGQTVYSDAFPDLEGIRKIYQQLRDFHLRLYYSPEALHAFADWEPVPWNRTFQAAFEKDEELLSEVIRKESEEEIKAVIAAIAHKAANLKADPELFRNMCHRWYHTYRPLGNTAKDLGDLLLHTQRLHETVSLLELQVKHSLLPGGKAASGDKQGKNLNLQAIERFLTNSLGDNISSIDMARHLYLNPSYFSRQFKKLTGDNFTDYVHRFKMDMAKKLLVSSRSASTEAIAQKLGYYDRPYFSKIFKKYVGLSPSEYKEKHLR